MKKVIRAFIYFILIVMYLLILGLWIAIPEELTLNISASGFTLALSTVIMIWDRERYARYYQSGHFKKLLSVLVSSFLIASILAMVNYFAFKHPAVLDLSALRLNSLTEKSTEIVGQMSGEIVFKVFALKKDHPAALSLIELYRQANPKVIAEPIDIEVRPDLVAQYAIVKAPTIVIEYRGRREYISTTEELAMTNALIKLSRKESPVIYFSTGHGELALGNHQAEGISEFEAILLNSSFILRPLDLARLDKLPADLKALAILGPKSGFHPSELKLIDRYLKNGGKILLALDPQLQKDPLKGLRELFKKHHINLPNDLVIDTLNHVSGSSGTVPLIKELNHDHLITKEISSYVFFPLSSSLSVDEDFSGRQTILAQTTPFPASWSEKNMAQVIQGKSNFDQGIDGKGPIALGLALEAIQKDGKLSRLVLFGCSGAIKNQYVKFIGNYTLYANALSWLSLDGQLDSFNLPFGENEPVFISGTQLAVIFYLSVLLLPLIMVVLAIVVYRRGRRS